MRSFLVSACVVIAIICLSSTFGESQQPVKSSESVWFALLEDLGGRRPYVVPIGTVSAGKIFPAPLGCEEEQEPGFKKFETTYLRPLQSYSVTFGSAPAGVVVLQPPDPAFGGALVKYDGPAHIHGPVMALATNAKLSESEATFRRAPSPEERKLALQFANDSFVKRGLPATLLQKTKVDNLTHTLLPPAKSPALIGSFSVEVESETGLTHALFFVATVRNGKLIPELEWVHISDGVTSQQRMSLIDHADLLEDGQDEIVVMHNYYEGYGFEIYRRTKDGTHWEQIFDGPGPAC
jgi:hypothetical protein